MANDFSGDANCISVLRFEDGALAYDTQQDDTWLTAAATPVADTSNYKEGAASVDLEYDDGDYFYCVDGQLPANFPWANGDSVKTGSVCFWTRGESSLYTRNPIVFGKHESGKGSVTIGFLGQISANVAKAQVRCGYNSGADYEDFDHGSDLTFDGTTWYHVGVVIDGVNKTLFIKITDASLNQVGSNINTSITNEVNVENGRFCVGRIWGSTTVNFDGLIDELVVFDDLLTEDEIDQIAAGTYGAAPAGPTNVLMNIISSA